MLVLHMHYAIVGCTVPCQGYRLFNVRGITALLIQKPLFRQSPAHARNTRMDHLADLRISLDQSASAIFVWAPEKQALDKRYYSAAAQNQLLLLQELGSKQ